MVRRKACTAWLPRREESLLGAKANVNTSGAVLQTLYKIKGKILPLKVNMAVNKMMAAEEAWRLNYCPLKNRTVAVVFTERRELPTIVFRNLEDVPEKMNWMERCGRLWKRKCVKDLT